MNKNIGVYPFKYLKKRKNLFNVLSILFDVKFTNIILNEIDKHDAIICFESCNIKHSKILMFETNVRESKDNGGYIKFNNSSQLDYRLRSKSIYDCRCSSIKSIKKLDNDIIFATHNDQICWKRFCCENSIIDVVGIAPEEINKFDSYSSENVDRFQDFYGTLRYQLNEDRFFSYVPIIHFLREVTSDNQWLSPNLRASFIIDDPNIRWLTYGNLDFIKVVKKAVQHKFHLTLATIPLDLWWASSKSIDFIKKSHQYLSLAIHGNNHLKREMLSSKDKELSLIAQALKRVTNFEKKYDVPISKIIIPPHEAFSIEICDAMARLGIEALCSSRPFGWTENNKHSPKNRNPLIGWYPSDFLNGGLPVITRRGLKTDFTLRAFLDQPIIVYFHYSDLKSGLEKICKVADKINRYKNVQWGSLTSISRRNFLIKKNKDLLKIMMFSRKIEVNVPKGINKIAIEVPAVHCKMSENYIRIDEKIYELNQVPYKMTSKLIFLHSSHTQLTIELIRKDAIKFFNVENPKSSVIPYLRRLITEGKDRFL